ncbi:MAG: hypothetical protein K6G50_05515 [bacterium]|nr:hypothetical protein [bacterium]
MNLTQKLQELHIPENIISLAVNPHDEDAFFFRCEPPRQMPAEQCPQGKAAIVLWQCQDWVTAVRNNNAAEGENDTEHNASSKPLEYIAFSSQDPEAWQVIAYGEQGLLANLFSDLIEDEDWDFEPEEAERALTEAAEICGFHYLKELLAFQEAHADSDDYAEDLAEWTKTL